MRLIDADKLIEAIEQGEGISWDSHGKDDLCVRKKYIDNAPTVEFPNYGGQVVPDTLQGWRYDERPHGKWLEDDGELECNLCGCWFYSADINRGCTNFCPNCGAQMGMREES